MQPGTEAQFLAAADHVIAESRREPGNLLYNLQRSVTDPQQFVFYELFKSDADLEFHKKSKHVVNFLEQVKSILLPGQFTLVKYDQVNTLKIKGNDLRWDVGFGSFEGFDRISNFVKI